MANQRGGGDVDAVSTGGAVGDDRVVRREDKLLAGVGKERWRRRGSCWRYLLPRKRRGRCLPGCVSWAGRSSSGGSHCSAVPGSRALGRFVDAGWQDSRAMRDSRGPCSEKCPFLAGSSRGVSSNGDLRDISDAWRANLATNWRFSRPRPLSGCMERKTCHGLPPENAPRRNLATARPPGTHRARILPLPVRPRAHQGAIPPPSDAGGGTHRARILPLPVARERISHISCHRQAPGNTSMKNLHNRHLTIVYKSLTRNQAEYNKEIGF